MKHLFLGGVADGDWIEVEDGRPVWMVPVPQKRDYSLFKDVPELKIETNTYNRVRFSDSDGTEFVVFVYDDDNMKPIARLIAGYVTTNG